MTPKLPKPVPSPGKLQLVSGIAELAKSAGPETQEDCLLYLVTGFDELERVVLGYIPWRHVTDKPVLSARVAFETTIPLKEQAWRKTNNDGSFHSRLPVYVNGCQEKRNSAYEPADPGSAWVWKQIWRAYIKQSDLDALRDSHLEWAEATPEFIIEHIADLRPIQ